MHSDDQDPKPPAAIFGILTLGLMSPEERAAALEEAEPDNVIWLEQYRLH
jgi:hypothetical protein